MLDRWQLIERRLRNVEDSMAIRDLKTRYWSNLDRQQLEVVRACLTADARIDMEGVACRRRDEFIDYI
ncbi:MAG TPA: nuclear transport factor 2 family protein, partial [Spongiibacteraceae bacterium]|nr:nuclear transport factor 2 family protein [Spongiibacteraceae bacterium]